MTDIEMMLLLMLTVQSQILKCSLHVHKWHIYQRWKNHALVQFFTLHMRFVIASNVNLHVHCESEETTPMLYFRITSVNVAHCPVSVTYCYALLLLCIMTAIAFAIAP